MAQVFNDTKHLTPEEKAVLQVLQGSLGPRWEIYVHPYLNGLRPDFVLLHPEVGIGVYEVEEKLPTTSSTSPRELTGPNPAARVEAHKNEIFELYCPRLERPSGYGAITAGVVFPNHAQAEIDRIYGPESERREQNPICGREAVFDHDAPRLFPASVLKKGKLMGEDLAQDFRSWLKDPTFLTEAKEPLPLDERQRTLVSSRTQSGYRRVRGPAGSGKSLVLAARAAELASAGKRVLVVTYNITLIHYLRELAQRHRSGVVNRITWLNFHSWCKRALETLGHFEAYQDLWRAVDDGKEDEERRWILDKRMPQLTLDRLRVYQDESLQSDAILVDEAQDFYPLWWEALRQARAKDGEMLLVADATQDVYGAARSWTEDEMIGAGFTGAWSQLKKTYRLPPTLLPHLKEFARRFLPKDDRVDVPESEQEELDLWPCRLQWVQVSPEDLLASASGQIANQLGECDPHVLAIADIAVLVQHKETGEKLNEVLKRRGIKTIHTFAEDYREARRLKMTFCSSDARVRLTTFHSFKGWERRAIVVVIEAARLERQLAGIYAALTRLLKNEADSLLTVVCSAPELAEYGSTWPS